MAVFQPRLLLPDTLGNLADTYDLDLTLSLSLGEFPVAYFPYLLIQ